MMLSIKVFNDDKINVTEMPRDLIVTVNVDKSETLHILTEPFIYIKHVLLWYSFM